MPGKPKAPSTLSGHAADIWQSAFESAYEGTCKDRKDRDACAASIAWSAVKNKYRKGKDGMWVEKASDPVAGETLTPDPTFAVEYPTPLEEARKRSDSFREIYDRALNGECKDAPMPEECAREAAEKALGGKAMESKQTTSEGQGIVERGIRSPRSTTLLYDPDAIAVRRLERELAERKDTELVERGMAHFSAIRPDHISSEFWRTLAPADRTVQAMVLRNRIERSYHEAVDTALEDGWEAKPNPTRPEEMVFRKWISTPDGPVMVRAVLVRQGAKSREWFMRELSRGYNASLALRVAPGELRYRQFGK